MFKLFCGLSAVFILWVITTLCSSFIYLTTWTLATQFLYFISEFHHNQNVAAFFQNLTWTPSIFIISYWPLSYIFHWHKESYNVLPDLCQHCFNIVLIIIAVCIKPKLEYRFVGISFLFSVAYLTFAVLYTAQGNSIYQTNFFKLDINILFDVAAVVVVGPLIHSIGVACTKLRKVKIDEDIQKLPFIQKKKSYNIFEFLKTNKL